MQVVYQSDWQLPREHPCENGSDPQEIEICQNPYSGARLPKLDLHSHGQESISVRVVIRDSADEFGMLRKTEETFLMQQLANLIWYMIDMGQTHFQIPAQRVVDSELQFFDYHVSLIESKVGGESRFIANVRAAFSRNDHRIAGYDSSDDLDSWA